MTPRYILGALLAVASGAVLNFGILVQKRAVNASAPGDSAAFLAGLLRNRTWILGLALQFILGTPMYAAAQIFIGPTLVPGLMATGLVVLALGSPSIVGERLGRRDVAGVVLVIVAVALIGLSRLSVDLSVQPLFEAPLVTRLGAATVLLAALSLALVFLVSRRQRWRGVAHITASGVFLALGNLWLGVAMGGLSVLARGDAPARVWLVTVVAVVLVVATNVLAMIWTQIAFRSGSAAALVPVQQVPVQVIPTASYFLVFALQPPGALSVVLAAAGAALILAGSALAGPRTGVPRS